MVSEGRVKLHARIEQRLIWLFELVNKIFYRFVAVQVVTHHHNKLERKLLVRSSQLVCDLILGLVAGAVITNDSELDRILPHGQLNVLGIAEENCSENSGYKNQVYFSHDLPYCFAQNIDDQVRLTVVENQVLSHKPIFQSLRQFRQFE